MIQPALQAGSHMFLDVRCPGCNRGYFKLRSPVCPKCVEGFGPAMQLNIAGMAMTIAGAQHEGAARRIVLAGKSDGRTAVFRQMARYLVELSELRRMASLCDSVAWVPGLPANVQTRGYDQGAILARGVATSMGLPSTGLFRRRAGSAQTGRSRQQRQLGPRLSLTKTPPSRVLLVDDVITTGVSMQVAADCLRRSGAEFVAGVSLTTRFTCHTS